MNGCFLRSAALTKDTETMWLSPMAISFLFTLSPPSSVLLNYDIILSPLIDAANNYTTAVPQSAKKYRAGVRRGGFKPHMLKAGTSAPSLCWQGFVFFFSFSSISFGFSPHCRKVEYLPLPWQ